MPDIKQEAVLKEPEFYQNNNKIQRRDATDTLTSYSPIVKWRPNARVLDVGCGDGGVTKEILVPFLPDNFELLMGCDISPAMIEHADLHHSNDRIKFRVLDITGEVPVDMIRKFDHVFSSYAIHWIRDQERAISSIYTTLAPGGSCLLALFGHNPICELYRLMSRSPRWSRVLRDVDEIVPVYHNCESPRKEFGALMKKSGFRDVRVDEHTKRYTFEDLATYERVLRSANPFNHRMTREEQKEFFEDVVDIFKRGLIPELSIVEKDDGVDKSLCVFAQYSYMVAYGVK